MSPNPSPLAASTQPDTSPAPPSFAENGWAVFSSFSYEGHDRVLDELPVSPTQFANPILAGCYPDPSICRAGNDYYLINSSFSYFPGIPIFHSTDLVAWKQIGHVLDRPSQLDLDGLSVSSGIFAPAISYHDGLFYVITTLVGGLGNFFVTAHDPAGPWSEPIPLPAIHGIDPAFFWDEDGQAYIVHNGAPPEDKPLYDGHRALWLWEFDAHTHQVKEGGRIILNGGVDLAQKPVWIEGPHIFKRGEFYYLCAAEGGTSVWHSQVVLRSRSVWGPYEPFTGNPILTQRDLSPQRPHPVTSVGHAELVETTGGEWWAAFLGVRPYEGNFYNTGRETFLLPVTWQDDWPVILPRGEALPRILSRPTLPPAPAPETPTTGSFSWRDDFATGVPSPQWNFLRTPREPWWSLTERPGSLLLAPRPVALHSLRLDDKAPIGNPSFIARRQQHTDFRATVTLDVGAVSKPSEAGIAALQNDANYLFLGVRGENGGARHVFLERHERHSPAMTSTGPEILATQTLPQGTDAIELKIEGAGRSYAFFYRVGAGDGQWLALRQNVDGSLLSTEAADGFVGAYVGLYARSL